MERPGLVEVGQEVDVSESITPVNVNYMIEPAVIMDASWNLRSIPDHKDQNGIKDQVAADLYKNLCGIQDRGIQGKCRTGRFI